MLPTNDGINHIEPNPNHIEPNPNPNPNLNPNPNPNHIELCLILSAILTIRTFHPQPITSSGWHGTSIASNIEDHLEPSCFLSNGNPKDVVGKMMRELENMSNDAYESLQDRFEDVFQ